MFICTIKNADGSHDFQIGGVLEPGYAAVPADMVLPDTFPFVNIEVAEVKHPSVTTIQHIQTEDGLIDKVVVLVPEYTQLEVISMTPGEEIPLEIEFTNTPQDDTDAMLVDHEYRLTLLELGLTEY